MELNQKQENIKLLIVFLLGALIVFLLFRSCEKPQPKIVKGKFEPIKPIHDTIFDTIYRNKVKVLYKENRVLDSVFIHSTDTIKLEIYRDAITIKQFNNTFKDCTVTINASGLVRGSVESLAIDYKLKLPQPKETVFKLLAGAEVGIRKSFDKVNAKASLIGQFKSGNQISLGVDTEQRFYVGGAVSLFRVRN